MFATIPPREIPKALESDAYDLVTVSGCMMFRGSFFGMYQWFLHHRCLPIFPRLCPNQVFEHLRYANAISLNFLKLYAGHMRLGIHPRLFFRYLQPDSFHHQTTVVVYDPSLWASLLVQRQLKSLSMSSAETRGIRIPPPNVKARKPTAAEEKISISWRR